MTRHALCAALLVLGGVACTKDPEPEPVRPTTTTERTTTTRRPTTTTTSTTTTAPPTTVPPTTVTTTRPLPAAAYYSTCSEAPGTLYEGTPGYRPELDRDGDGVACESDAFVRPDIGDYAACTQQIIVGSPLDPVDCEDVP